jgi:hypothetical protein
MKITISNKKWNRLSRSAQSNFSIRLVEQYPGSSDVEVFKGGEDEPYFIIMGVSSVLDLDRKKIRNYLQHCDWTDRGSAGWLVPRLKVDDFLKDKVS